MITPTCRIIFAGTPDFAASALAALIEASSHSQTTSPYTLVGVYTQPDRPAGRGQHLTPSPVKLLALAHDLPVFQPHSLRPLAAKSQLRALQPDLMVVAAYGLLLPVSVLNIPRLGCVNIHASLLPRWRGAAPIQRAIIANDPNTGITLMQMDKGLDTGGMLTHTAIDIKPDDTASSLHDRLADLGARTLMNALPDLLQGKLKATLQNHSLATYANKLSKEEAHLDWHQDAAQLARKIRAFNPFPGAFTLINNQRVKLLLATADDEDNPKIPPGTIIAHTAKGIAVRCGQGVLYLTQLQLPGGKALAHQDILNAPRYQKHLAVGGCFN